MQMMTRTATAIALAVLVAAPGADAQDVQGEYDAALKALIDPAPVGAGQEREELTAAEIKSVMIELLVGGDDDRIAVFGESAGPPLRELAQEASLDVLLNNSRRNPLRMLIEHAPLEALTFFHDAQQGPWVRYESLIRSDMSIDRLMGTQAARGEARLRLIDLLDRTLASPTLDIDIKLRLAVTAHKTDLGSARALSLIRDNAEYVARKGNRINARDIYDAVVPAGTVPPIGLPAGIARALIARRPSIEVLDALSRSPHQTVRFDVAVAIRAEWKTIQLPRDRTVAILTRLATDVDGEVVSQTTMALSALLANKGVALQIEDVTNLVAGLADRPTDPANFAESLAKVIHEMASRAAETDAAKVEALYRTAFASKMTPLHQSLASITLETDGACALAYFRATDTMPRTYRSAALEAVILTLTRGDTWRPGHAELILDTLMACEVSKDLALIFLARIAKDAPLGNVSRGRGARGAIFLGLPPARVPEAVRWLAAIEPEDETQYRSGFSAATLWPNAGIQLRAIVRLSTETTRARLLAGTGVLYCTDATATDANLFAAYLGECLADPGRAGEVERYFATQGNIHTAHATSRVHSLANIVTRRMLEDSRVPDSLAVLLPLDGDVETDDEKAAFEAVLDAAERRAAGDSSLYFVKMRDSALRAMVEERTAPRPALLRAWLLGPYVIPDAITVVLGMPDNDQWIDLVLKSLMLKMRSSGQHQYPTEQTFANQILRLPGDEPVQVLLEYVMRSDSGSLVEHVDNAIAARLRIREAAARWSSFSSGSGSINTAKVKVLRLLDSKDPAIKAAAIRGLGTLGAVEALPQLIELVGSDEPGIREAALETLDLLNRQAALRVDTASAGASGAK